MKILRNFQDYYAVEEMANKLRLASHLATMTDGVEHYSPYAEFMDDQDTTADNTAPYVGEDMLFEGLMTDTVSQFDLPLIFHNEGNDSL